MCHLIFCRGSFNCYNRCFIVINIYRDLSKVASLLPSSSLFAIKTPRMCINLKTARFSSLLLTQRMQSIFSIFIQLFTGLYKPEVHGMLHLSPNRRLKFRIHNKGTTLLFYISPKILLEKKITDRDESYNHQQNYHFNQYNATCMFV